MKSVQPRSFPSCSLTDFVLGSPYCFTMGLEYTYTPSNDYHPKTIQLRYYYPKPRDKTITLNLGTRLLRGVSFFLIPRPSYLHSHNAQIPLY